MKRLEDLLHGGGMTEEELARVREVVIFSQPNLKVKLVRFWILLILASAIAATGLLGDSVATVIGAMIVAPLMLPIMGLAFGISTGSGRAILVSLGVSVGGIATAIGVGFAVSQVMTSAFDPEQVGQIMSRTAPNLIDMLAALATGLAGAFAIGRKDISDTLPGVAIAISLVPPLANAGILLGFGRTNLALGSILLFVTNYLAIVLMGAIVFGLMGYPKVVMGRRSRHGKRIAMALVLIMFVVIAFPLGFQSLLTWAEHSVVGTTTRATKAWLEDTEYTLVSVDLDETLGGIDVVIKGSGELPDEETLIEALKGEVLGLDVVLEVIPAERVRISTQ